MSGVVSGCDGSGYVFGICTADLMTLFSMLSVLMFSVVVCIVSFACVCRIITSDL